MNIVAKSQLIPPFSLASLSAQFPFSSPRFLCHIPIPHDHVKFSIFRTGNVISRASTSLSELESSFAWLRRLLHSFELELVSSYDILNIVAVSPLVSEKLDLLLLAPLLPHSSYDPTPFPGENAREFLLDAITFYFNSQVKPRQTALIFKSGTVTLTGFRSIPELESAILQLRQLLDQIVQEHPEVLQARGD